MVSASVPDLHKRHVYVFMYAHTCTGSVYCDKSLKDGGFIGEILTSGNVLVVKAHFYDKYSEVCSFMYPLAFSFLNLLCFLLSEIKI